MQGVKVKRRLQGEASGAGQKRSRVISHQESISACIISLFIHGEGIRDWRREAGKVNEEVWDDGKAGDDGPVTGGVVVKYELLKVCEVALCRGSW